MSEVPTIGYLQLTLHLVNGSRKQFVQTDPDTAQKILDQLRPERFFAQKQLHLFSDESITLIPLEHIERVDLQTDPLPVWPHNERIHGVDEITEEDFLRIQRREPPPPPPVVLGRPMPAKPPLQIGILVEFRSGCTAYLSVYPRMPEAAIRSSEVPTSEDMSLFFQHLFARPVLFGKMEDEEGIFLLNPANVIRFTLAPPPPEPSAGAWPLRMNA
jgi:hypothetical protein